MDMTAAVMRNVGWNTAATLGVALTSGAVADAVNQMIRSCFEVPQESTKTSSAAIRTFAFITGAAAGVYALHKTTVVNIDFDHTFLTAHALSMMTSLYLAATAYLISFAPTKTGTVLYASASLLTIMAPFAAHFGKNALIPAIGIGAAVGSYL